MPNVSASLAAAFCQSWTIVLLFVGSNEDENLDHPLFIPANTQSLTLPPTF
jgi:hypothetical protein